MNRSMFSRGGRSPALATGVLLAILSIGTSGRLAHAQDEPPGYRDVIAAAVREYDEAHYPEARSLFGRANQLYPNARSLRGLGMVEFELRNYLDSIGFLEQALASRVKTLDARLRRETELLLARAREFICAVQLSIEPPQATVLVDGSPAAVSPEGELALEVGDHTLEVRASGYQSERRTLKLKHAGTTSLEFALSPQASTAAPPPDPRGGASSSSPMVPVAASARAAVVAERPPSPESPPATGSDAQPARGHGAARLYVGPRVAAGGRFKTDDGDGAEVAATPGLQLGGSYALARYFSLGGELGLSWYKPKPLPLERALLIDVDIKPRFVLPLEHIDLELSCALPIGLTIAHYSDEWDGLQGKPGFNVGLLLGATYFVTKHVGLNLEIGWVMHRFGVEQPDYDFADTIRFSQASFALSALIGF